MARKRVAVYFLHEYEASVANEVVKGPDRIQAGGYVLGDVEDEDLERLYAEGIAVEVVDATTDETWLDYRSPQAGLLETGPSAGGGLEALGGAAPASIPEPGPGEEVSWALQVHGPLVDEWRTKLASDGLNVAERVSRYGYLARGTRDAANAAMMESFVQQIERATSPAAEVRESATSHLEAADTLGPAEELYDMVLDGSVPVETVIDDLEARNVEVVEHGSRRVRVRASVDSAILRDPKPLPGVLGVSGYVEPELLNDHARLLIGATPQAMGAGFSLDGSGQVVAVTDTGIDEAHPDFWGRLRKVVPRGRDGDASDPNGHGTHVAGSIVGTGAASGGAVRGIAPAAELVFQSVLDARGGLGGLRAGLHDLLDEAYALGARIHNHSWGSLAESEYRADSLELDAYVWEHPDVLVVVAAGNDGTATAPMNAPPGFVDLFSLRAPATAKNALTVGAACSDRIDGSMIDRTWSSWDASGRRFPPGPVGDTPVSGNAEALAAFSSRGPCQDRRIKPDVVAPGTDILSTRSSLAPPKAFWGEYGPNSSYAYMGGTSMASPIVSGLAVLVRQWYVDNGHDPSAALLKATLINGCRWLAGADATSSNRVAPNYDQGFGGVHLPTTIPNEAADPPLALHFIDTLGTPALQFARETDRPVQATVTVGDRCPLRICLCFTDAPGRFTQNDLTLIVQTPDGNQKVFGNPDRPKQFVGPDVDNTVEVVRLSKPTAGPYLINVVARNILRPPQGFALVVTGDLGADFKVGRH